MKGIVILLIVAVVAGCCTASPAKGSTKASLNKKPSCGDACTDDYTPICAKDEENGKTYSFGNRCVLDYHNCENKKDFKFVSKGECPGGGSVRLS